ncbi:CopG family ribbon-helix-helix protein [Desulforamulus ferrireducens]|uniref:CopG family transcriptional regulator n=1 Tax=Desulforamulus ferrireducens TaxID=1833852 RepID=A0A1S6IZH3_9FIRM|nr:ribbon-helix-helix protein, CopG family [Desulforamulus ferrireducens]AQS60165.1 CopG family transcriptional regulator [Desulforamulus ferrireducens]
MAQTQSKRIMISLPNSLLAEVDNIVEEERVNRSEFIREAMKLYIAERNRRILREQMKKGYLEMAKLNLALAIEYQHVENVSLGYELAKAEG